MIQDLITLSDKYAISYLILQDDKAFSGLEKKDLLKLLSLSIFTGEKEAAILQRQYKNIPLPHIAANLGLKISYAPIPSEDNFIFSKYDQSHSEIIIDKNIIFALSAIFNHKLPEYNLIFNVIRNVFLGHEIFHHLEIIKNINLDKEFKFTNWKFGPLKFSSTPKCATEIAAFAFSQKINNLSFHPKILEYIYSIENLKSDPDVLLNKVKEAKKISSSPLLNI